MVAFIDTRIVEGCVFSANDLPQSEDSDLYVTNGALHTLDATIDTRLEILLRGEASRVITLSEEQACACPFQAGSYIVAYNADMLVVRTHKLDWDFEVATEGAAVEIIRSPDGNVYGATADELAQLLGALIASEVRNDVGSKI